MANRKPLRRIHDDYPQFSAVAVDNEHNEVVTADENLFQTMVYDRTTNTPPQAKMSEPKRSIGGSTTFMELQCAVYIDPKNGDIYSLNNDTERHMTVWGRNQSGNVPPKWKLHTPLGSFGLAVDEQANELIITGQHENVVVAFPKTAREEDPPSWVIWGDKTLLADPHGIALDTKKNCDLCRQFWFDGIAAPSQARRGLLADRHWAGAILSLARDDSCRSPLPSMTRRPGVTRRRFA